MPPEWHPPEEYFSLLKGVTYGSPNESPTENRQANLHEHREENQAHQRETEERKGGHQALVDISEIVKILLKILREVDEIYHTIVGEQDDGKDNDPNV